MTAAVLCDKQYKKGNKMWSNKNKNAESASREEEMEVKVVLVGDSHCGKTSLVQRFISDNFNDVSKYNQISNTKINKKIGACAHVCSLVPDSHRT